MGDINHSYHDKTLTLPSRGYGK